MKTLRVFIFLWVSLVGFAGFCLAAEPSFNSSFTSDGAVDAYKIENSFSSSAGGINSVLANPAGIARSSTCEITVGYGSQADALSVITYSASDEDFGSLGGNAADYFTAGLYLTDDPTDAPTNEFKSRDLKMAFDYERGGGITDFGIAYNFGGMFAIGVSRKRPSSFSADLGGYAPAIFRNSVDIRGHTVEAGTDDLTVDSAGRATYSVYSTADPLFDKFTRNSSYAAVSTDIKLENEVTDSREMVLTFGGTILDNILWGINAIPISSNILLNNTYSTRTATNSANLVYYVPDFDTGDPASIADWFDETDKLYTREAGYTTYTMVLSPESEIYRGMAVGEYSASAMRVDLGFIWEPFNDVSVSFVYENIGGANLVYRGEGVYSSFESYVKDEDAPDFQVGSSEVWNPLAPTPQSVDDGFSLPDKFTINLPKKGRLGLAIKKPFFFAIDYERYFSDIFYEDLTISDLTFLKFGLESSLFGLPLIIRGETEWLLRPTISGATDQQQEDDINAMLDQFPAIPASNTLGLGLNLFGYEVGADVSENHACFLSIYEGQLLDFMKLVSYDLYLAKDNWDVTCTAVGEPFYLFTKNAELLQTDGNGEASVSDIQINWIYSLKFGYRF